MICIVIKGPTIQEARKQIDEACQYADVVELRLDYFVHLDIQELQILRHKFSIPFLFTLRSKSQGGNFQKSETERLQEIMRLAALNPEYFDLEDNVAASFVENFKQAFPSIKLIISHHNFSETPANLDALLTTMQKLEGHYYKIAVTAKNATDALRFLCWTKKSNGNLIAISMGEHGQLSRILAPIIKSPFTYASIDESGTTAPGQLLAKTLCELYRYPQLSPTSEIYGLIGDPVSLSISDVTHNRLIQLCGLDAVYVKMQVKAEELPEFLSFAKTLPFKGLSVTMPLKELIMPLLDYIDPTAEIIGAVNTVIFHDDQISGYNTDAMGALNAIEKEMPVKGKKVIIIGAGGAAKAIIFEAIRRGAIVTIVNRDASKAHTIAEHFHCQSKALDNMGECCDEGYDILINSTPSPMPVDEKYILPKTLVMDIKTRPKETPFLICASEKGCRIIYGYRMFVEQAVGQFNIWFQKKVSLSSIAENLELVAQNTLDFSK